MKLQSSDTNVATSSELHRSVIKFVQNTQNDFETVEQKAKFLSNLQ